MLFFVARINLDSGHRLCRLLGSLQHSPSPLTQLAVFKRATSNGIGREKKVRKRREGRGKVKERVKDRKEGEGFPLPIGESGSGDGGGEEGRRARTGFRVGASRHFFFPL